MILLNGGRWTCANPESFVRGGPTLTFFFFFVFFLSLMRVGRIQIPLLAGHQMAFRWRADDGTKLNARLVAL